MQYCLSYIYTINIYNFILNELIARTNFILNHVYNLTINVSYLILSYYFGEK